MTVTLRKFISDINQHIKEQSKLNLGYDEIIILDQLYKITLFISPFRGFYYLLDPISHETNNNKLNSIELSFKVDTFNDDDDVFLYSWLFTSDNLTFQSHVGKDGLIMNDKQIDNLINGLEKELKEILK